ncbi:MAG: LamG domain-containing protein [Verrucomicrobiae bacterium]|nr:LamG domain-containing protein [Verrucomicrobiae bacterium]
MRNQSLPLGGELQAGTVEFYQSNLNPKPHNPLRDMHKIHLTGSLPMTVVTICGAITNTSNAGYATFSQRTDTISIAGNTVLESAATYEAVVRPYTTLRGLIWNEIEAFAEDKQFGLTTNCGVYGYGVLVGSTIGGGTATTNEWHHYAFVYDGLEERLYIDGNLVKSRSVSGNIPDGPQSQMVVGAVVRNNAQTLYDSFLGDIDSLRISKVARYSGDSFTPIIGDLPSDAATVLLYNFNDPTGTTVIMDESGNGHTGILGDTFTGATSPIFSGPAGDPVTLMIKASGATPSTITISWQSTVGHIYQPETAGSLADPDWQDFGPPITGTGATLQIFADKNEAAQKFYRLRISAP